MKITHTQCLVCKGNKFESYLNCTDYFVTGESFTINQCTNCSFLFTQDIPSSETIAPYYKSEKYISHSDTQKGIVNKLYHQVRNIMLGRKYRLIKKLSSGKTLLDIGCGTGYFPNFMKLKGYNAFGMELEQDARNFASQNFGLELFSPEYILEQDVKDTYDIITLWHVMEHLHDPVKYLTWIHQSLKPDGVLLIALPNSNSFDAKYFKEYWAAYDVPRHLWHFTPETFKKYLVQFGFELKQIKRLPFDAYYNSLMSARYKQHKLALISGFIIGLISNIKSFICPKTTSSVIYILKKA
jgi:2-polyprenyl-3-methyl-5-hydroxy-6-metoxy-1,4-benzoquinol methylase